MVPSLAQKWVTSSKVRHGVYIVCSVLLPVVVVTLGLIALHITPFGNHCIAVSDGKYYINGAMSLGRLLRGEESILYSFKTGLGGNRWAGLAWGGISIGGLLSAFGTLETMPTVFTWICVVNIAVCGLTMYVLLAYVRGGGASNLIFSTSYALIGFNVANCYQTLFFWGPQMLPLVALGLLRLMRAKSPLIYVLSLATCTFFDFYFAFHIGVFSALYFLCWFYAHKHELKGEARRIFLRLLAATVIAVMLAAPMWLPALKAYSGGGRLNQTGLEEFVFTENMPFIQMFSKLFTGAHSLNELITGMPNIFCGILPVALTVLYFTNGKVDLRWKRAAAAIIAVYVLTFYINAFTMAMHGGTHTNWFPYRYSYVFSFVVICLAAEEFSRLDEISLADTKRCGVVLLVIAILVFSTNYEFISGGTVLLDFALLALMWVAFRLHRISPERAPKNTLTAFLLLVVCANLYANFTICTSVTQEWELDLDEYNKNTFVSGALVDVVKMYDQSFYRMEKDKSESGTIGADPGLYGYHGVSHSGPTERAFIHSGLNRLGINWYDMRHWYSEGIPAATDSLLGLKYLISDRDLTEEKGYERLVGIEGTDIYNSKTALGIAALSDAGIADVKLGNDAFMNLNSVWRAMTGGKKDVFTEQDEVTFVLHNPTADITVSSQEIQESVSQASREGESNESSDSDEPFNGPVIEYSFIAKKSGPIYCFDTSIPDSAGGLSVPSIKYSGYYEAGEEVKGTLKVSGLDYVTHDFLRGYCANLAFAYADNDVLAEYAKQLQDRHTTFESEMDDYVVGEFAAQQGQRLLFTIPWDEGWTLYVDGQEVPLDKTWNLFMSAEVPAGEHTYEMRFRPAWMNIGIGMSAVALMGLVLFIIVYHKRQIGVMNAK